MKITKNQIQHLGVYVGENLKHISDLWGENHSLSLTQICDLDINIFDKAEVIAHFMPERDLQLFMCECAMLVLPLFETAIPADSRPKNAVQAAINFANNIIDTKELKKYYSKSKEVRCSDSAAWYASRAATKCADQPFKLNAKKVTWLVCVATAMASNESDEKIKNQLLKILRRYCVEVDAGELLK